MVVGVVGTVDAVARPPVLARVVATDPDEVPGGPGSSDGAALPAVPDVGPIPVDVGRTVDVLRRAAGAGPTPPPSVGAGRSAVVDRPVLGGGLKAVVGRGLVVGGGAVVTVRRVVGV